VTAIDFLKRAVAREQGNQAAVARNIGLSRQRLSDALKGRGGYPLGIKACLRLAVQYGESVDDVLRANGKEEVAALLQRLGLPTTKSTAPDFASVLAERIRELPETDREIIETVTARLEQKPAAKKRGVKR
jgi:transcriptional regulator with XRE-family HTH domain